MKIRCAGSRCARTANCSPILPGNIAWPSANNPMSKGFASNYRLALLASGLVVCFAGLGVRLAFLHVVDRGGWRATIVKAGRQRVVERPRRGDTLDPGGAILATSRSM